jgi:hypothetical protein
MAGIIQCTITLNSGNVFKFYESEDDVPCTNDGQYCARVQKYTDSEWKIVAENQGSFCTSVYPFEQVCETYGSLDYTYQTCYDHCSTDAC